jgi:cytoskeletal protein RodZ
MIDQTCSTNTTQQQASFGIRLQTMREERGLDRKEAASQLRLPEHIIVMLENGEFNPKLPRTFIRGYIRSYSKFLELPEQEIQNVLELLNPPPTTEPEPATSFISEQNPSAPPFWGTRWRSPQSRMLTQLFSCLILLTVIGLMGVWWNSHKTTAYQQNITPVAKNTVAPDAMAVKLGTQIETQLNNATTLLEQWTNKLSSIDTTNWIRSITSHQNVQIFTYFILLSIILYLATILYLPRKKRWLYLPILFLTAMGTVLLGLGSTLVDKNASTNSFRANPLPIATTQPPPTTYQSPQPQSNPLPAINLETAIEELAPIPDLNKLAPAMFRVYPQQKLAFQLNNYIEQAAAVKFALTDPSTPLGQITYKSKKKVRKHRRIYNRNNGNYDNHDNNANSVPPYYRYNY